jgi:hypothetical protein
VRQRFWADKKGSVGLLFGIALPVLIGAAAVGNEYTAPPPGPLGILSPPGSPPMRQYQISSNNAQQFLGTFYLPAGRLIIDAARPVAAQSAYTVVVTRQIDIKDGPNLVLNSDYASTDVPVPEGVGNATQKARLAQ